jgi:hypothetical protein
VGAEARCQLRLDGRSHEGKALLETDELRFRGDGLANERGLRLTIPFASIRTVNDLNGALRVSYAGGDATFELGDKASTWAERIRSPKSLIDKLEVKAEHTVSVVALRDEEFLRVLNARAAHVVVGRLAPQSNIVFLGADDVAALARIANAATVITRDGAIWVIHPKGSNELRDTDIFAEAKRLGLTYTKVARFSATHTAEKLVIPRSKR